jgi:hypothetical protein
MPPSVDPPLVVPLEVATPELPPPLLELFPPPLLPLFPLFPPLAPPSPEVSPVFDLDELHAITFPHAISSTPDASADTTVKFVLFMLPLLTDKSTKFGERP